MGNHKLDTYNDGNVKVPFCTVCGLEGLELNSECSGKYVEKKRVDKKEKDS